ncbi:hypothetical protein LENED_010697 [Lentinula edodes]|uniref:Uncharacterized protein n=1 Tax=Lentinula edodes TaxID=5353 RepID=A0A1Q3EN71_LENED|nr:hypothetical protein LENED_010697 [Lentinula edodes]
MSSMSLSTNDESLEREEMAEDGGSLAESLDIRRRLFIRRGDGGDGGGEVVEEFDLAEEFEVDEVELLEVMDGPKEGEKVKDDVDESYSPDK